VDHWDGPAAAEKPALRKRAWTGIRAAGAARFPGVEGRIPNFVGAEAAAERLGALPVWQGARVLKCNPDSPHRPVRHRALKEGKIVVLAVPKLRSERPFLLLDPAELAPGELWAASSVKGATALGRPVGLDELPAIDLVLTGCVACTRGGARLGKGGGYSDLEFALLRERGLLDPELPVVTTVHDSQLWEAGALPMAVHDVPFDWIVTPTETVETRRRWARPEGIRWGLLSGEQIDGIPALAEHPERPG
jgi:5-formyltetrahydrofolate cyclo-ligase